MTFGVVNVAEDVAGHGQAADERCILDTGDAWGLLDQFIEKTLAMALLAAGGGVERDLGGDDLAGVESRVDMSEAVETVEQQAGGGDDDNGKSDLADHQGHGDAEGGAFADDAEAAGAQALLQVGRGHLERRHESEKDAGEHRGRTGEKEDVPMQ